MNIDGVKEKMGNLNNFLKEKENSDVCTTDTIENCDDLTTTDLSDYEDLINATVNMSDANENLESVENLNENLTNSTAVQLNLDVKAEEIARLTSNAIDSFFKASVAARDDNFFLPENVIESTIENFLKKEKRTENINEMSSAETNLSNQNVADSNLKEEAEESNNFDNENSKCKKRALEEHPDEEEMSSVESNLGKQNVADSNLKGKAEKSNDFDNENSKCKKRALEEHPDALIKPKEKFLVKDDIIEATFLEEFTRKNKRRHISPSTSNSKELSPSANMDQVILKKFLEENSCYSYSLLSPVVVLETPDDTMTMEINRLVKEYELEQHEETEIKRLVDAKTSEARDILKSCQLTDNKATISELENQSVVSSAKSEQENDDKEYFDKNVLTSWLLSHNAEKKPKIVRRTKAKNSLRGCLVVAIADSDCRKQVTPHKSSQTKSEEFQVRDQMYPDGPLIETTCSLSDVSEERISKRLKDGSAAYKPLSKSDKFKEQSVVDGVKVDEIVDAVYPEDTKVDDILPRDCSFSSCDGETSSLLALENRRFLKKNQEAEKLSGTDSEAEDDFQSKKRLLFLSESGTSSCDSEDDFVSPHSFKGSSPVKGNKNKFKYENVKKRKSRSTSNSGKIEATYDSVASTSTYDGNSSLRILKKKTITKAELRKELNTKKKNVKPSMLLDHSVATTSDANYSLRNLKQKIMKRSQHRGERNIKKKIMKQSEHQGERNLKKVMKQSEHQGEHNLKKIMKQSEHEGDRNLKKIMKQSAHRGERKLKTVLLKKSDELNLKQNLIQSEQDEPGSYSHIKEGEYNLMPVHVVLEDIMTTKIKINKKDDLMKLYDCPKLLLTPKVVLLRDESILFEKNSSGELRSKRYVSSSKIEHKQSVLRSAKTPKLF